MNYNIFDRTAPAMPKPAKGTESCRFLLSKASKDMREPLVPMALPALSAHLNNVEFMYSDNKYYELCGQMGHLIGPSGIGKAQLTHLIEAIMRSFRDHDETEYQRLADWQRQMKTRGANKEKPERPDVAFWFPPADLLFELSHRSIFAAWKKGATLWILNDQTWTRSIGEFMVWFCYYDLWSKVKVFGDLFKSGDILSDEVQRSGPKNMLDDLPNTFNEAQLEFPAYLALVEPL